MLTRTPIYDENGDILAPEFFVESQAKLAGVLNSGLDRDNFAQNDIVAADVNTAARVFNKVVPDGDNTAWSPNMANTSWQAGTGTSTGANALGYKSFTLTEDAHCDVSWGGTWSWNGTHSWVAAGARPDHTDTFDTVTIRVSISGQECFTLGPFSDSTAYCSAQGFGAIVLPAGDYVLLVEAKVVRIVAQTGDEDGACTNTVTFTDRHGLVIAGYR